MQSKRDMQFSLNHMSLFCTCVNARATSCHVTSRHATSCHVCNVVIQSERSPITVDRMLTRRQLL